MRIGRIGVAKIAGARLLLGCKPFIDRCDVRPHVEEIANQVFSPSAPGRLMQVESHDFLEVVKVIDVDLSGVEVAYV